MVKRGESSKSEISLLKTFLIVLSVVITGASATAAAFNTFETIKMHEVTYADIQRRLERMEVKQDTMGEKINNLVREKE